MDLLPLELQFHVFQYVHNQLLREVLQELVANVPLAVPKREGRLKVDIKHWYRDYNLSHYVCPDWGGYCHDFISTVLITTSYSYKNAHLLKCESIVPCHCHLPEIQARNKMKSAMEKAAVAHL